MLEWQLRIHREREAASRQLFSLRKRASPIPERLENWLAVDRHGVMDPGFDLLVAQVLAQGIAVVRRDHEKMVDVSARLGRLGKPDREVREVLAIGIGEELPAGIPF